MQQPYLGSYQTYAVTGLVGDLKGRTRCYICSNHGITIGMVPSLLLYQCLSWSCAINRMAFGRTRKLLLHPALPQEGHLTNFLGFKVYAL